MHMRPLRLGSLYALMVTPLTAQAPSPLRDLPPLQVLVGANFLLTEDARSRLPALRSEVIRRLRIAGVPVAERESQAMLVISISGVPSCGFAANVNVHLPVLVAGNTERTSAIVYASQGGESFAYDMAWADHRPVLGLVDDFIEAWRRANRSQR